MNYKGWQWTDLKAGDKVKFNKDVQKIYGGDSWAYRNKNTIFVIEQVELYDNSMRISIPSKSIYISINLNGADKFEPDEIPRFFDIIELAED